MAEHSWPAGLPAYPGGRLSPKGYPAGFGLRIPDYEYTYPDRRSRLEFLASLRRYEKAGFSLPPAEGNKAVCKAHLTDAHNDFLFTKTDESLTVAYRGDAGADRAALTNTVFTVTETCAADFARFLQEAQAAGWVLAQENEPGSCHSAALMQAGRLVWASLMAGTARITEDRVSALPEPPAAPARPRLPVLLCQYGLAQGKMRPGIRCDCGMLYLLRLGDGSLFVADGGEYEQAGDAVIADVLALMRRLTGTRPGERIPIAAWFCTHPHDDHMDLFGKLLRFHHEELAVERLLFNFASEHFLPYMPEVHSLLTRAAAYCPQAKFYKLHSGQRFLLGGTTFTVLQTHEDGTGEHGDEFIGGYNDTSVVLRADTGRASVLFLGDLGPASERVLLRHWSSEALRSDAVQAAHHLFNDVPDTYRAAAPGLFLVPQVREAMHWSASRWQALTDSLRPGGEIAFSADGTILWEEQPGGWKRIGTYPAQDADYDGSPV